jgi:hypothetical protein
LILGMASCIALRTDAAIAAIWTGTVAGTALGHALALFNTRSWFALLTILTTAAVVGPSAPGELSGSTLWLAFIPAATCAYWSLGDRTTLIAFWFPSVIWMLSILDHAQANGIPNQSGIVLLGVLAILFLAFLRVRESRRAALWATVAAPATTLAQPKRAVLLKERAGFRLARTGWAIVASALAFGATAWVAPKLWRSEELPGTHERVVSDPIAFGLPCCPVEANVVVPKARVKEYFSIGHGHDEAPIEQPEQFSCTRCEGPGLGAIAKDTGPYVHDHYSYDPGSAPVVAESTPPPSYGYSGTSVPVGDTWTPPAPTVEWGGEPIANSPPAAQVIEQQVIEPPTPAIAPAAPVAPPAIEHPDVAPDVSVPHVAEARPPVVAASEPPPAQSPPPPPVANGQAPYAPTATHRAAPTIAPSLMQWIGVVLAAALLMQLGALALRPLRRFVTLRHLRRPYWQETVDQRVSNAWQLALVGLRDAGWRADSQESPRDLAHRVGIDGIERCAAILERARHGIGIDADDLSTMTSSAESAYRDARARLGTVARATTWLRWPLT